MYRFAICDDDNEDLQETEALLIKFLETQDIMDFTIDCYQQGQQLLDSDVYYDLILLDIELKDMNGIQIAHKYLCNQRKQNIIFISNSTDYMQDGYRVEALRYITKPIKEEIFFIDLKSVLTLLINDNHYVFDECIPGFKIRFKDIQYIEVQGRHTYIYTKKGVRVFKRQLKVWENLLKDYHFVKVHSSFIVNLKSVRSFHKTYLHLQNGEEIPISRTYQLTVQEEWYNFMRQLV